MKAGNDQIVVLSIYFLLNVLSGRLQFGAHFLFRSQGSVDSEVSVPAVPSVPDGPLALLLPSAEEQVVDHVLKDDVSLGLRVTEHSFGKVLVGQEEHCRLVGLTDYCVLARGWRGHRGLRLALVEAKHFAFLNDG